MEFGKVNLKTLSDLDLSLPPDDPRTWIQLKKNRELDINTPIESNRESNRDSNRTSNQTKSFQLGVGCPVWGVKEWVGLVYPPGTKPKDYLYHYSRQFNTIELNTTHYRTPDAETIQRWRESTPDGFKFCVKFLQEISHRRPISSHAELTIEFIESIMGLEDKLGISFLQLPPSFSPLDLPDLQKFLEKLPQDFELAVEFRHSRFFSEHMLIPKAFQILEKTGTHAVITDVAGRRDVLHTSLPTSKVLVRFIGNDLHPSDDQRISDWVARLHTWMNLGIEEVQFFIHQSDDNKTSPELINRFIDQMNTECNLRLRKWTPLKQTEQLGLF